MTSHEAERRSIDAQPDSNSSSLNAALVVQDHVKLNHEEGHVTYSAIVSSASDITGYFLNPFRNVFSCKNHEQDSVHTTASNGYEVHTIVHVQSITTSL